MRSYFDGFQSVKTGGVIPDAPNVWVHIAAVTDGTTRRHYIDGNLVFEGTETAPTSNSTRPMRIGSDPDWDYMAAGAIDTISPPRFSRCERHSRISKVASRSSWSMTGRVIARPTRPAPPAPIEWSCIR